MAIFEDLKKKLFHKFAARAHTACCVSKILNIFVERLKIHEIKDLRKFSTIQYWYIDGKEN